MYQVVRGEQVEGSRRGWRDEFFDEDGEEVLAVFDFDYEKIKSFESQLRATEMLLFPPFLVMSSLCCVPCFLTQNVKWNAEARHVALTQDGIRYVVDRHPTCCGCGWSDKGKVSKTVPYDKITDCDVEEPAGNVFVCCVKRVLSTVNVDTASSGGAGPDGQPGSHELTLSGLVDPHEFKKSVWAMKRGEPLDGIVIPESMYRGGREEEKKSDTELEKRALAFDFVSREIDLEELSKVDFLLADKDYATTLKDALDLHKRGLLDKSDFGALKTRVIRKLRTSSA